MSFIAGLAIGIIVGSVGVIVLSIWYTRKQECEQRKAIEGAMNAIENELKNRKTDD